MVISCASLKNESNINSSILQKNSNILSKKSWVWEGENCNDNPHNFIFNLKENKMTIKWEKPIEGFNKKEITFSDYKILSTWRSGIRAKVINEVRVDKNGNLVEWDLIIKNDSTYYWHRKDWPNGTKTKNNIKC
jgi:hypothetical protein